VVLHIDGRQTLRAVIRRGLLVRVRGNEPYVLRARATVDRQSARRAGLASRQVTVGTLRRSLPAGSREVRMMLRADARRALRRAEAVRLKVSATASDAGGSTRALRARTARLAR
jgi:hypothetical protein